MMNKIQENEKDDQSLDISKVTDKVSIKERLYKPDIAPVFDHSTFIAKILEQAKKCVNKLSCDKDYTTIYQADLPVTIRTSGNYHIASNLTYITNTDDSAII